MSHRVNWEVQESKRHRQAHRSSKMIVLTRILTHKLTHRLTHRKKISAGYFRFLSHSARLQKSAIVPYHLVYRLRLQSSLIHQSVKATTSKFLQAKPLDLQQPFMRATMPLNSKATFMALFFQLSRIAIRPSYFFTSKTIESWK